MAVKSINILERKKNTYLLKILHLLKIITERYWFIEHITEKLKRHIELLKFLNLKILLKEFMEYLITTVEKSLKVKLRRNAISFGVDTATVSGIAKIHTTDSKLIIETNILNMSKVADIKDRYELAYSYFNGVSWRTDWTVVVEDVFFGRNVKALIFMSRLGMICYACAMNADVRRIYFINASSARKNLGLPSKGIKQEVQKIFKDKTKIIVDEENVTDAIILALNGLLINENV